MKYKVLSPISKREILYSEKTLPADLSGYGRCYLEEGLIPDALELFNTANDEKGLHDVKTEGIQKGESFILRRIERLRPNIVTQEDWLQLGENAFNTEKFLDALEGFTRGGNEERKAEVEERLSKNDELEESEV